MSDKVVHGICLFQKKILEKDIESTVFSKEKGLEYIKTVSSLKGSGLNIPLCSTSEFYLATRSTEKHYILKDIKILKTRENIILDYKKFTTFSLISSVLMRLGGYDVANSFKLFEASIDLLETEIDPMLIASQTIEKFFVLQGISGDYEVCPYCGKHYDDNEIIGYSYEHNCNCCNNCASVLNVLSSKLRVFLRETQKLNLATAVNYNHENIDVHRLISFECFRLKKLLNNKSKEIEEFISKVNV